jgi:hypothetical protein
LKAKSEEEEEEVFVRGTGVEELHLVRSREEQDLGGGTGFRGAGCCETEGAVGRIGGL